MICVKNENRFVYAEGTREIFNFFKVIYFSTKKYCWNLLGNINLPKLGHKWNYKTDFAICTEHLIAIVYEYACICISQDPTNLKKILSHWFDHDV